MHPTLDEQQLHALIEAQAQGEPITVVPTDPTPPADAELDPRLNKGGGGGETPQVTSGDQFIA